MVWLWWLGAALVLGVVETLTVDLTFLMLAGGAVGGAAVAAAGMPLWVQVVTFGIVSALLLASVRPWVRGRLQRSTPTQRTNVEGLVGQFAITMTTVTRHEGRIRLAGGEWSAKLAPPPSRAPQPDDDSDDDDPCGLMADVPPGKEALVVGIDGAYALIRPIVILDDPKTN